MTSVVEIDGAVLEVVVCDVEVSDSEVCPVDAVPCTSVNSGTVFHWKVQIQKKDEMNDLPLLPDLETVVISARTIVVPQIRSIRHNMTSTSNGRN